MQNTYNLQFKKQEKRIEKEVANVYDVVANFESWLGNRQINIDDVVVSRWIAYEKQVIKKQREQKNGK